MKSSKIKTFSQDRSSQKKVSSSNQQNISSNTTEIVTALFVTPTPISRFSAGTLTMDDNIFSLILREKYPGFRCGDKLTCIYTERPMPGTVAILERNDCGRWPILVDEAGPEIAAGARLVGQVNALHRNLLSAEV